MIWRKDDTWGKPSRMYIKYISSQTNCVRCWRVCNVISVTKWPLVAFCQHPIFHQWIYRKSRSKYPHYSISDTHWRAILGFLVTVTSKDRHGVTNHLQINCLFNRLFRRTSKKTLTLRIISPFWKDSNGDRWYSLQKGSHAENISMWWRLYASDLSDNVVMGPDLACAFNME